jgi:hypothetical protein
MRSLTLLALACCSAACGHAARSSTPSTSAPSAACPAGDLEQTLASAQSAPVIVVLNAPAQAPQLLDALGAEFKLGRSYLELPGFAGTITRRGYALARAHRDVRCIQLDHPGSGG